MKNLSIYFYPLILMTPLVAHSESLQLQRQAPLEMDLAGKRIPIWRHGALHVLDQPNSVSPKIISFDSNGRSASTVTFSIPGATWAQTISWDVDATGKAAICGNASDTAGRIASFIAWRTADGVQQVVRTNSDSYVPFHVAIAPDGYIWTLGSGREDGPAGKANGQRIPRAATIRRFDSSGKQASAYLPLSEFKDQLTPDGGLTLFAVGPNNKAVVIGTTEDTVFEVSSTGQVSKYIVPGVAHSTLFGPALTPDGDVFVGIQNKTSWTISKLDRAKSTFVAVSQGNRPATKSPMLLGADGDSGLVTFEGGKMLDFQRRVK